MSHHFDTPTAKEDPRINVCDFYLFRRAPGTVAMALTVNPNAGVSAPDTFRNEAIYAFRFALNGDAREEVTFKVRFGEVSHAPGDEHRHTQSFEVLRAEGESAVRGAEGNSLAAGNIGEIVETESGIRFYAGLAPDLFAGDGVAAIGFTKALFEKGIFEPSAFTHHENLFAGRNVTAIVLEVPTHLVGEGKVHAWATASLFGHAPEVQVSRWGIPLLTHFLLQNEEMKEEYNRASPADDTAKFAPEIGRIVEKLTTLAGSAANPAEYAKRLLARICPTTLPYILDTEAGFNFAEFNGRALEDDVMDVILTLITNTALGDGVAPDKKRIRREFPYFGEPFETHHP